MASHDTPELLAVEAARLAPRTGIAEQWSMDLRLGAGELAFVEVSDPARAGYMVDVCLGLEKPLSGTVRFRGTDWQSLSHADAMRRREEVGVALWQGNWLQHQPLMDGIVLAALHHRAAPPETLTAEATRLARRFGLPGLPAGRPFEVPQQVLLRAACVRAFLGTPQLVILEDPAIAGTPSLQMPLAAELVKVQNRGGGAIVCVPSLATRVCGMLGACGWLRLGDRGLGPARRSHEYPVGLASLHQ